MELSYTDTIKKLHKYPFDWSGERSKDHKVIMQTQAAINHYVSSGTLKRGWKATIDYRGKRRAGYCNWRRMEIGISSWLFNLNDWREVENTILHEIAHAIASQFGDRGHGWKWKTIAQAMGDTGERCLDVNTVRVPKGKYTLVCRTCGRESQLHRLPKYEKACGKCCREKAGGKYDERFKMDLIKNR